MVDSEKNRIRRRADAATDGPWTIWNSHLSIHAGKISENTPGSISCSIGTVLEADHLDVSKAQAVKNARFAAHARTDVPRLLDALEGAEQKLAEARPDQDDYDAMQLALYRACKELNADNAAPCDEDALRLYARFLGEGYAEAKELQAGCKTSVIQLYLSAITPEGV